MQSYVMSHVKIILQYANGGLEPKLNRGGLPDVPFPTEGKKSAGNKTGGGGAAKKYRICPGEAVSNSSPEVHYESHICPGVKPYCPRSTTEGSKSLSRR